LLLAERKGQEQLKSFVEERLMATLKRKVMLRDPLPHAPKLVSNVFLSV
jgi:hypothetical protein